MNGYVRTYNMAVSPFRNIKADVDYINDKVEFERSLAGNDDDLDDE